MWHRSEAMFPVQLRWFLKGKEGQSLHLWQAINLDIIGIRCPRFGNSTMIVRDLVNRGRDCHLRTIFEGNLNMFSAINEEQGMGCCLVHAINAANRTSLSYRCFKYYHLHYKYTDHSEIKVTFAISESYRVICRVFPMQRYSSYRVLVSPFSQPLPVQIITPGGLCPRRNL